MFKVKSEASEDSYAGRLQQSTLAFVACTFVWAGSFVLIDKAHLIGWLGSEGVPALLAICLNTLLGLATVVVYIRHLRDMDELQQKIQLQAMGFALGLTLVGAFAYSLFITTGFVTEPEVKDIILLLTGSYIFAVLFGLVKYR
ncbi:hypothetical protein QWI17_19830 [Gilvimarinus sp. SDUM040013]|uniref:EamA domain-containing protein n=1 Tax=Gilvimarinus gilvus TaxID=3058038 RepID=A0ABU4RZI6_9GAMM|nr:hypothetical protein [Gilvimarinus sp. SDUM040013]MDO3388106.1 hypothetical protein [Gilvimarinus sp. SDUM040013]MDX6850319.1 hypothetical protein [Gilvimarinus sp. SDUM040013]